MPTRRSVSSSTSPAQRLRSDAMRAMTAIDCFSTPLLPGDDSDPVAWAHAVFVRSPRWVRALLAVRKVVVAPFGLSREPRPEWGTPFPVISRTADELVLGLDDRHLDFRLSVAAHKGQMCFTTSVRLNNTLGELYWAVVRRVHPHVMRALLRRTPAPVQPAVASV